MARRTACGKIDWGSTDTPFFLVTAHLIVSSQVAFKDAPDDVVVVSVSSCLGSKKRIVSGAIMNVVGIALDKQHSRSGDCEFASEGMSG
jgi:hypothetical protein